MSIHSQPKIKLSRDWDFFQLSMHTNTKHNRLATKDWAPVLCALCQMRERRTCVCWRLMDCLVEVNHAAAAALLKGQHRANKQGESMTIKKETNCVLYSTVILFFYFLSSLTRSKRSLFFSLSSRGYKLCKITQLCMFLEWLRGKLHRAKKNSF